MKNILLIIISCLSLLNVSAQYKPTTLSDLEDSYTNYFKLNRELVFVHLNKTSVIKKESLWLSAYVYNAALNCPNSETVNLNLDIFTESGNFIESKTVLIAGGKGSTFINLNKDIYPAGKYLIKASTKFMKNFQEDLSFVQSFEILGASSESLEKKEKSYDLQLLPEGGHILAEVWNNIGVKLIDSNGNSVIFSEGKLLDQDSNVISTFKSNQFGLSKFNFLPIDQQDYQVEITTVDGEKLKATLPKADLKGLNIVGNNLKDQFIFKINTNNSSKDLVKNKMFYAAIHKDGNIKDFAFQFPQDKLEVSLKMSKDSLYSGINTLTIFDENFNPLLERLFFNNEDLKRVRVNAQVSGPIMDSVKINLKSVGVIKNNSLSISVLPGNSKAYDPKHNILSAFYIKPYINGDIDNGDYYFSDANPRKLEYDLDLLLLTQGWSKFEWSSIYNKTPKQLVLPESGFTINGKINGRNEKKENTVFIKSEETGLFEIVNVREDDTFILKNIYVQDSSALSYGLMNSRNSKISKPSISANISPDKSSSKLNVRYTFKDSKKVVEQEMNFDNFIVDTESLDTIILVGENKKADKYLNDLRVIKPEVTITEEIASRFLFITDYIAAHGFKVIQGGYGSLVIANRSPSSLLSDEDPIPQIYFNGMRLGTDTSPLVYLKTSEVESIIISTSGVGYGMTGNNGVIEITTRKGGGAISSRETILEIITTNGFTVNKEFYAPKYTSYTNEAFKDYGVIDWISDLSLEKNGTATFKFMNTLQSQVSLFIEGISVDGNLISEEIKIKI
ncbi:hypothetical protein BC962_1070 [Gillisia mitskevichiae]|uniref:TonB-dependent receptor-like protein n=1 Tax=Gillisia mitskevichiae TaxID=270921 RepID=A0A495PZX7_9FLAO|nr:hypothetical protein [Gillisia mitskevichiae]RKS56091.1 hypothetical protein BC962_1070 [Gillisia mitskevichiae]